MKPNLTNLKPTLTNPNNQIQIKNIQKNVKTILKKNVGNGDDSYLDRIRYLLMVHLFFPIELISKNMWQKKIRFFCSLLNFSKYSIPSPDVTGGFSQ